MFLARHGATVFLTDIDEPTVHAVAAAIEAEHGAGTAFAAPHDVRDEARWQAVIDEAVAAIIVPAHDPPPSEEELREHCSRLLARFKVPTVLAFADELPKTSIGKVRKDVLRKQLEKAGG